MDQLMNVILTIDKVHTTPQSALDYRPGAHNIQANIISPSCILIFDMFLLFAMRFGQIPNEMPKNVIDTLSVIIKFVYEQGASFSESN